MLHATSSYISQLKTSLRDKNMYLTLGLGNKNKSVLKELCNIET